MKNFAMLALIGAIAGAGVAHALAQPRQTAPRAPVAILPVEHEGRTYWGTSGLIH
jgi:hypothetical protein